MSLVEVILALGICACMMMAVLSLLPTARVAVKRAQIRIRADAEAQSVLEHWRVQSFDSIYTMDLQPLSLPELPVFQRHLEVTAGSTGRMKELRVTVAWDWAGKPQRVEHQLVICNLPR